MMETLRHTTVDLSSSDAVEQFLTVTYGDLHLHRTDQPRLQYHCTSAGGVLLDTLSFSAALDLRIDSLKSVVVSQVDTARIRLNAGRDDWRFSPGDLYLSPYPDQAYNAQLQPGTQANCVIDPMLLGLVADPSPGRRPKTTRFTTLTPISAAAGTAWQKTRRYVTDLLAGHDTAGSPLLIAAVEQLLATVTLTTFATTAALEPQRADRRDATPASLHRAIAFIDDNAHRPITPADIANAAFISIRALQLTFRRHLDTTPTAYLRRARLNGAHQQLATAASGTTTVGTVAVAWGFADHSRFTADRAAYGVTPTHTLHH